MISNVKVAGAPLRRPHTPTVFTIICGVPAIAQQMAMSLEAWGFQLDAAASTAIILDAPRGFALRALHAQAPPQARRLVVTGNHCPEYLVDLWDFKPDALVAESTLYPDLPTALAQLAQGTFRQAPPAATPLTSTERQTLRLLAQGHANQDIADQLAVQCKTIKNTLTAIYTKLRVRNRNEALLYYWGIGFRLGTLSLG
jgi:DNA-binding NarL/FixJ family response regulator